MDAIETLAEDIMTDVVNHDADGPRSGKALVHLIRMVIRQQLGLPDVCYNHGPHMADVVGASGWLVRGSDGMVLQMCEVCGCTGKRE